jgi:hypothetical protein
MGNLNSNDRDRDRDLDAVIALIAELEQYVMHKRAETPTATPTTPVEVQPLAVALPPQHAPALPVLHVEPPQQHASLAENALIQWLVQTSVPWSYQQQVMDVLHKMHVSKGKMAIIIIILISIGAYTGQLPIPDNVMAKIKAITHQTTTPPPVCNLSTQIPPTMELTK